MTEHKAPTAAVYLITADGPGYLGEATGIQVHGDIAATVSGEQAHEPVTAIRGGTATFEFPPTWPVARHLLRMPWWQWRRLRKAPCV